MSSQTAKEQRIIHANDLGTFYPFVIQHISNCSSVDAVIDDEGTVLTYSLDKANVFNQYFSSVGITNPGFNQYSAGLLQLAVLWHSRWSDEPPAVSSERHRMSHHRSQTVRSHQHSSV